MRRKIRFSTVEVQELNFCAQRWHTHLIVAEICMIVRLVRLMALSVFVHFNFVPCIYVLHDMNDKLHSTQYCVKFIERAVK